jgi:hypothetical protein
MEWGKIAEKVHATSTGKIAEIPAGFGGQKCRGKGVTTYSRLQIAVGKVLQQIHGYNSSMVSQAKPRLQIVAGKVLQQFCGYNSQMVSQQSQGYSHGTQKLYSSDRYF